MTGEIRFLLNGDPVTVTGIRPATSVLTLLRERLRHTGTKEGCAEGDCGACTVVIGEAVDGRLRLRTVNACIRFAPTLDGKALFTVEGLKRMAGGLHPVQQAMVDCHGSQCGFCTPGFVMSLWGQYVDHTAAGTRPDRTALCTALSGNLCRCTGYKPILEAGERMFDLPPSVFDPAPILTALAALRRPDTLDIRHDGGRFLAPRSLAEALRLRAEHPDATVLAGCTDIGLWVNKQLRELPAILYVGEVEALKCIIEDDEAITVGAGVSLEDAYAALARAYPAVRQMWERFASLPIRNAGTLGGNIANGSPIGDSMPWLIAVGAQVTLAREGGQRTLALEDLYLDYMKKDLRLDELVTAIRVPRPRPETVFRTYKLSKRYDSDISAVCAAFAFTYKEGRIAQPRVAFGGMAATPRRATRCENALRGQPWTEATVRAAMAALADDFTPLSDMRAASAYRQLGAANLLYRFYLETRPDAPLTTGQTSVFATA